MDDKISSIILLTAIEKEVATVTGLLKKLKTDISSIPQLKILIENATGPKELTAAVQKLSEVQKQVVVTQQAVANGQEKLAVVQKEYETIIKKSTASLEANIKKQNDLKAAIKGIGDEQKRITKEVEAGSISADAYRKKQTELGEVLLRNKQRLSEVNAELKDQVKLQFAQPGTIKEAKVQNSQLSRLRDNTQDPEKLKEINTLIDKNNELIDSNSDALAKQKINIGNYPTAFTSAFKVLNKELDTVGKKIAAGASGSELTRLTQQQQALQNAVGLTGKEFATTGAQQKAYNEASRQLGVTFGTNSTVFKDFTKEVGKGSQSLKDVQKEVNNAAGGTPKLIGGFKGVFAVLRNIANIIPGLGLSGIVLLLLAPLQSLAEGFISLFTTINKGKIAVAALNEVNGKAIEIYNEEKTQVIGLVSVLNDNTASLVTKQEALKQLIAISPQYLSGLTLENIATAEGTKILDGFIGSLQRKAELQAAIAVNADSNKVVAGLQAERQALVDLAAQGKVSFGDLSEAQQKFFDNSTSAGRTKFTTDLFNLSVSKSDIQQALKNFDDEIKKASVKVDATNKIFTDKFKASFASGGAGNIKGIIQTLRDEIDRLTKEQPTLLTEKSISENVAKIKKLQDELDALLGKTKAPKKDKDAEKASAELLRRAEADRKALFQIFKDSADERAALAKKDADNEELPLRERLNALIDFNNEKQSILIAQKDFDLANTKLTEKEKEAIINKFGIDSNAQLQLFSDTRLQILRTAKKKEIEEFEKAITKTKELSERTLETDNFKTNQQRTAALIQLEKDFGNSKVKSVEDYNRRKKAINDAADKEELGAKIKQALRLLAIDSALGRDTTSDFKRLQALKVQFDALELKGEEDKATKKVALAKRVEDAKRELLRQSVETLKEFITAGFDVELQDLEERQRLLNENTQRRLNQINLLGLTEVERTRQTAIVQKEAAFQNEQIEKRKRQIAQERARFEKAANIASIIANTAAAVIAALKVTPAPGGIPFALLTGAIGAVQLARAIATPIPKYAVGTDNAKGGLSIVGELGSELVVPRSGQPYLTPAGPTLTQLAGGEKIFPADITKLMINASNPWGQIIAAMKGNAGAQNNNDEISKKILRELKISNAKKQIIENNVNVPIENTWYYIHHIKN